MRDAREERSEQSVDLRAIFMLRTFYVSALRDELIGSYWDPSNEHHGGGGAIVGLAKLSSPSIRRDLAVVYGAPACDFLNASQNSWGIVEVVRPRIHLFGVVVQRSLAMDTAAGQNQFLGRVLYGGTRSIAER